MDNSNDKKTKRPRIGESRPAAGDMPTEQRNSYTTTESTSDQTAPDYHQGGTGYRPRQQGGYQPRYNQGGYHNRYNAPEGEASADTTGAAGENNAEQPNTGYRPRYQQGGYQPRHTGYQPRQQGGYRQQQGGYQNQRPQRQNQFGMPRGGKSFVPRPKRVEYEMPLPDPDEQIRLNKFMANAGICSRREADEFIQQGLVKVNGNVVTSSAPRSPTPTLWNTTARWSRSSTSATYCSTSRRTA